MSRTVRRKKFRYNYEWVLCDYGIVPDGVSYRLCRITLDRHSRAGRKRIAKYHAITASATSRMGPRHAGTGGC